MVCWEHLILTSGFDRSQALKSLVGQDLNRVRWQLHLEVPVDDPRAGGIGPEPVAQANWRAPGCAGGWVEVRVVEERYGLVDRSGGQQHDRPAVSYRSEESVEGHAGASRAPAGGRAVKGAVGTRPVGRYARCAMDTLLYDELAPFYHLLDPLEDHAGEGEEFGSVLRSATSGARSLLELGAGAGHGAFYLKDAFERLTLVDLSPAMLARSRRLNPDCEHLEGDMRTLRLGRTFDCLLIHDAITYLTSVEELAQVAETAFDHLRPGGAALVIPDCVTESFVDSYEDHAGDDDERSLRCLAWSYDPDPTDTTHVTDYALLLRENGEVRAVHDRHVHGLFPVRTWIEVHQRAGFEVTEVRRPLAPEYEGSAYTDRMFLCLRPSA